MKLHLILQIYNENTNLLNIWGKREQNKKMTYGKDNNMSYKFIFIMK